MRLFHPLGFMLASPVETSEDAVARFSVIEPKAKADATAKAGPSTRASRIAQDDTSYVGDGAEKESRSIEAFLEDKYDGMRAQVHCGDVGQAGRVAIYSRNKEDVTESFPELAEAFASVAEPLIFDGEILGWDLAEARALPFAVLGQRIGRKKVSNDWRERVPVVFMAFDLMYAGGELLLELPLRERRNRLEAVA
jgi:DNA ligase-1